MRRIGTKLWFGITMLILFIIAMVWIFQVVLLRNFYISERKEALLDMGTTLAEELTLWDQSDEAPSEANHIVSNLFTLYDTRVVILGADDQIIISDTLTPPQVRGENLREFMEMAKPLNIDLLHIYERAKSRSKTTVTYSVLEDKFPPNGAMFVTAPIILGNNYKGKVVLFMPLAPIDESATILQKQLSIISALSLLVGSLFAFVVSREFTRPILNIREATHQIAAGNFDVSLTSKSKDEVGNLTRDIKDMASRLEEINQERKDFIANASHDLRTPITLIQTYAEYLIDKNDSLSEEDQFSIQIIHDEAQRLGNIVDDLLYLSKIESRGAALQKEPHALADIAQEIFKNFFALSESSQIEISISEEGTPREVTLDKQKIQRVLYNLVDNINTHASGVTKIDVKLKYGPSRFRFEISDNGCGISENDLKYVWDRFYKIDKSRTSNENDSSAQSGIGMAIIKQILIMHQYEYGIESKEHNGTTVWFQGTYS